MHIPDNYLSPSTCAVLGIAMVPVWATSIKKIKAEIPKEKIPLLGIGAAFSFLGMMFNIPLPGGTTGHAVGGTLIAALCGPYAACISVTIALFVQALLFGDGGILAFGANCFNMAFVLPFVGYMVSEVLKRYLKGKHADKIAAGIGAYLGINAAALCAAIEFGIQPLLFKDSAGNALYCPYSLSVSIPAMALGHLTVFGAAEVIFTVAVLVFMQKAAPDMVYEKKGKTAKPVYLLLGALITLTPLGLLATGTAWGEWGTDEIAEVVSGGTALGYTPKGMAEGFRFSALFSDYSVAGMPEWLGYMLSAVVGAALVVIFFKIISSLKKSRVEFD